MAENTNEEGLDVQAEPGSADPDQAQPEGGPDVDAADTPVKCADCGGLLVKSTVSTGYIHDNDSDDDHTPVLDMAVIDGVDDGGPITEDEKGLAFFHGEQFIDRVLHDAEHSTKTVGYVRAVWGETPVVVACAIDVHPEDPDDIHMHPLWVLVTDTIMEQLTPPRNADLERVGAETTGAG